MPARRQNARSLLPGARRPALAAARPRLTHSLLDGLDAALVFVPAAGAEQALARLPLGSLLVRKLERAPRKPGSSFAMNLPAKSNPLVVVGLVAGDAAPFSLLELAASMVKKLQLDEIETLGLACGGLPAAAERACIEAGAAAAFAAAFTLPQFKSQRGTSPRLASIVPITRRLLHARRIEAVAEGGDLVRWLTALPPDRLNPAGFRRVAETLARRHGLRSRFHGEAALRRVGAGAFLAVSRGSASRDAGILQISYRPRGKRGGKPIMLVGKGICFDTGGTNLKNHKGMLDMHTDKSGSAVALASLLVLARLDFPQPVEAWLALAENRIGPTAYQPQDVVTACNGVTVQVIHTDAEGRMVLADTLALASRGKPAAIVDFATLTGACVTALTERYSGGFTNRPAWRPEIERAGHDSGERIWCLPMDDDFDTEIDSRVADVIQCPVEGKGDHIYAARFLKRFVGEGIPWLHVDLSAATRSGGLAHVATDITGFGVRFLSTLLLDRKLPAKD